MLGAYKNTDEYLREIEKANTVSSWAKDIIAKIPLSRKKKELEVALLTFEDLGLKGVRTTQEIKDAAIKLGYGLPDAEIGLALALAEKEIGDWWITLHIPIKDSDGDPHVLSALRRGEGRWVGAYWDGPVFQWIGHGAFAFPVLASSAKSLDTENSSGTLPSAPPDLLTINGIRYRKEA